MIYLILISIGVLMSATLPQLLPLFIGAALFGVLFRAS
jgi:hypothetical protein